jgi:hypothetical protein
VLHGWCCFIGCIVNPIVVLAPVVGDCKLQLRLSHGRWVCALGSSC